MKKKQKINFKCNKNVIKILKLNSLLRHKDYFFWKANIKEKTRNVKSNVHMEKRR